jgi:nitroreductase/ketosteroid isomerase-like protein
MAPPDPARFAADWIAAWNDHDLDAVLGHYAPDVEFVSPFAVRLLGDPSGTVRGVAALRDYFARALEAYPDLRFELLDVLEGASGVTLDYLSVNGLRAAETMQWDDAGRVTRVLAHYAPARLGAGLYDVMRSAPTTRRFTDEPVDPAVLQRVLDAARFAPSGGNRQGWGVIVVRDRESRRALRDLYAPHWRAYLEATGAVALLGDDSPRGRMVGRANDFAQRLDEVPVHLVVGVELASLAIVDAPLDRVSISGGGSIYPFVQNLLLGLRAEGLGAAFTTILMGAEPEVRDLLGMPEGVAVAAHIAVGHRASDHWPQLSRRPVEEFAFGGRWGDPL